MAYTTDEKLKSYLDTNQMHREQLCLAVLALDKRFTEVRPRHPRGGPDGGRDIEAKFNGNELAYGAVGFVNQAADVEEKKKTIRKKFCEDLESAHNANPRPSIFIFFTNVNFTIGEKESLVSLAHQKGFTFSEVIDRERIRISLDSPDGFAARFQFLSIPMSEAEQASFFAKWGNDIQSVITTGFQEVHSTLSQLLFLQEASRPLLNLHVHFTLDKEYDSVEIGHFRAFCSIHLREPKHEFLGITFGSADKSRRFSNHGEHAGDQPQGIASGISSGQWKKTWNLPTQDPDSPQLHCAKDVEIGDKGKGKAIIHIPTRTGSGVGLEKVKNIVISYSADSLIRFEPVLSIIDLDECMILPQLNESFSKKVQSIGIYANGYMLLDLQRSDFTIDNSNYEFQLPEYFSDQEIMDRWVRVRPITNSSVFTLSFADNVPVRMFKSKKATLKQTD